MPTIGAVTCMIVMSMSGAPQRVKSKEFAYSLKRVAALERAIPIAGVLWISARNNGAGSPEDGHEQDGEDSGNAVDHHLGEKTVVVEEEEVASSSRLWEATAEDYWPFTQAFYTFFGVPIGCEAVWRFLIFSIHDLRDTPFIFRAHVPIGHRHWLTVTYLSDIFRWTDPCARTSTGTIDFISLPFRLGQSSPIGCGNSAVPSTGTKVRHFDIRIRRCLFCHFEGTDHDNKIYFKPEDSLLTG